MLLNEWPMYSKLLNSCQIHTNISSKPYQYGWLYLLAYLLRRYQFPVRMRLRTTVLKPSWRLSAYNSSVDSSLLARWPGQNNQRIHLLVERVLMVWWVVTSIPHGGTSDPFLVPASAPQLVQQKLWHVLSCLYDGAYKKSLAANQCIH